MPAVFDVKNDACFQMSENRTLGLSFLKIFPNLTLCLFPFHCFAALNTTLRVSIQHVLTCVMQHRFISLTITFRIRVDRNFWHSAAWVSHSQNQNKQGLLKSL
jgi:hypothetical protein